MAVEGKDKVRIVDSKTACFGDNYIGVRGLCDDEIPDSGLYIDDLPGINLKSAALAADTSTVKGSELLEKSISQAIRVAAMDFIGLMAKSTKGLQFNEVLVDDNVRTAGSDSFTEQQDTWVRIKIEKTCLNNKFEKLKAFGFQLQSNCASDCVDFYVKTSRGEEEVLSAEIKVGINNLDIVIDADVEWVTIEWKIDEGCYGIRSNWLRYAGYCWKDHCDFECDPCVYVETESSEDGITWVSSNDFGFNASIQCYADPLALACFYKDALALPIQYLAGAMFFIHVKATDRINEYTENSREMVDEMLLDIVGGLDITTGIKHSSKYWRLLKNAVERNVMSVSNLDNQRFLRCVGDRVTNQLPG